MATNKHAAKATTKAEPSGEAVAERKEITADLVEYLTDYARQNPGHAALWCLGVGFVLGWKLKPW